MSDALVVAAYGCAAVLAAGVLYYFGPARWYWHLLAVALAIGLGLVRFPEGWNTPYHDLAVGAVFLFLFLWGVLAPLFAHHRGHHHHRPRHA
jgi:hypothetical protein